MHRSLNPFEIRASVQRRTFTGYAGKPLVSIPLKSGHRFNLRIDAEDSFVARLNPFEIRASVQLLVGATPIIRRPSQSL